MQRSSSVPHQVAPIIAGRAAEADTHPPEAAFGAWGHDEHWHPYGQFIYAAAGSCTVTVDGADFTIDETRAVWIPPRMPHSARFTPGFSGLLRSTGADNPSAEPLTLVADEELRRTLLASAWEDNNIDDVLAAEFARLVGTMDGGTLALVEPRSPLISPIAAALRIDPADPRTLDDWAAELHSSSISIRRAFRQETGLPFSEWRTRVRLNASIDRLRIGDSVSSAAHAVGFSHNGLLAAFHRHLDCAPSMLCRRPSTKAK